MNLFWKYFPVQKNFQCAASWFLFYLEHSRSECNRIISIYEYGAKSKIPICQLHPKSQSGSCPCLEGLTRGRPFLVWPKLLTLHPMSAMRTNQDSTNPSKLEKCKCSWDTVAPRVYITAVYSSRLLSFLRPWWKVTWSND